MYTLLTVVSMVFVIFLDKIAGTKLLQNRQYYVFLGAVFFFKLIVNGILTARIVMYDPAQMIGIRLMTIPLEDFGFGFSMVTLAVIVWEKVRAK